MGSLLLLSPAQVNPRLYRTHFLLAVGLAAVALAFLWGAGSGALLGLLGVSIVLAFGGSVAWSLEGAPAGRVMLGLTAAALVASLGTTEYLARGGRPLGWVLADSLTSAVLIGTATTAMLIGHSYLIAPTMSLTPLLRMITALLLATLARVGVAGAGLWFWTAGHSLFNLEDETVLWLLPRWGLGFVGPLVLGWMAWQTGRMRSTQSATGILYVLVIFCFLGELTSQLLLRDSGLPL
jgi:hypothetical protein